MSLRESFFAQPVEQPERVEIAGKTYVAHPLTGLELAEVYEASENTKHYSYYMVVASVKDEDGNPVFAKDDVPKMASLPAYMMTPLVAACNRVNKFSVADAKKN